MPKKVSFHDDSQDVVTKGFLRVFLRKELTKFKTEFKAEFREEFNEFKQEIRDELLEQTGLLAASFVTKTEWANDMDKIMGTLKAMQEDLAALLYRQREHSDTFENHEQRLQTVETHLGIAAPVGA